MLTPPPPGQNGWESHPGTGYVLVIIAAKPMLISKSYLLLLILAGALGPKWRIRRQCPPKCLPGCAPEVETQNANLSSQNKYPMQGESSNAEACVTFQSYSFDFG